MLVPLLEMYLWCYRAIRLIYHVCGLILFVEFQTKTWRAKKIYRTIVFYSSFSVSWFFSSYISSQSPLPILILHSLRFLTLLPLKWQIHRNREEKTTRHPLRMTVGGDGDGGEKKPPISKIVCECAGISSRNPIVDDNSNDDDGGL